MEQASILSHQKNKTTSSLQVLVVIVDREKVRDVEKSIQTVMKDHNHVHLLYVINGVGTANSKMMDMLGIGSEEKGILFCIEPRECVAKLKQQIKRKLHLEQPGNGIVFALPLKKHCDFKRSDTMSQEINTQTHNLVIAIINQGYSDDLMHAAKAAGARGGTIVRARRIDTQEAVKLFGISVQLEKEIVMIVVPSTIKKAVAEAIKPFCGKGSESKGLMFSLAAEDVFGISFEGE